MIKNNIRKRYQGFTLLEMIIVITLIGLVAASVAVYTRKMLETRHRQQVASALIGEISGLIHFVNAENISYTETAPALIKANHDNSAFTLINPLYDPNPLLDNRIAVAVTHKSGMKLEAGLTNPPAYVKRVYYPNNGLLGITEKGGEHHSFPLIWGDDQADRKSFIDTGCGSIDPLYVIYFHDTYLSCHISPTLENSPLKIDRIDLVNNTGSVDRIKNPSILPDTTINRIDVFLKYDAARPQQLASYYSVIMDALEKQGITPSPQTGVYLVQEINKADHSWQLVKQNGDVTKAGEAIADADKTLIRFSQLPDYLSKIKSDATYGIRLSFDGSGQFLRSDGAVAAKKLCWSTSENRPGPCLHASDDGKTLVLNRGGNSPLLANLQLGDIQANDVVLTRQGADGKTEYYTSPSVQFANFSNGRGPDGSILSNDAIPLQPCYVDTGNNLKCDGFSSTGSKLNGKGPGAKEFSENGPIRIPRQHCPANPADPGYQLFPRLVASPASTLPVIPLRTSGGGDAGTATYKPLGAGDFTSQANIIDQASKKNGLVSTGLDGGTLIQVNIEHGEVNDPTFGNWIIFGIQLAQNTDDNRLWQFYNPVWLTVQITTWCSSERQKYSPLTE